LEKIEMKKTLVAVAAMAAATGAMAQATISGFFDSAYTTNKSTTAANATTSASTLAPSGSGQNQITFGNSEDLGNGMKAFANLRIVPSPNAAGAIGADASEIGISGGFGTLQIGKDYSIDHGVIAQVDASGYTGGSKGVVNIGNGGASSNAVVYVLPQLAPGLGIVIAKGLAGAAGGDGDATAYRLSYSTGGLMVQYAGFSVNNIAAGTASAQAQTSSNTTSAGAAAVVGTGWQTNFSTGLGTSIVTKEATTANSKSGGTALGITYDLGMAKLHYGSFTAKSGGDADQKAKATIMGVSVPLGATTIGFTSSTAQRTNAAATTVKASGTRAKVSYALSKRTTVYGAYGAAKVDASTAADKQTAFGLTHSF
jgi:predicted porin